jgi:hypothetical protein
MSLNLLSYKDFKNNSHNFSKKQDEIILAYKSQSAKTFVDEQGSAADKIAQNDTRDPDYLHARVDLNKPDSIDSLTFMGSEDIAIPVMREEGRERYFLPASFVLRIYGTSTNVIEEAESTGKVLGYKIIRKYAYQSNVLGEQVGDDEDKPLERVANVKNNNYGFYVVRLPRVTGEKPEVTLFRILREYNGPQKPKDVQYAEVDEAIFKALRATTTPLDPDFGFQWGIKNTAAGSTRTNIAWADATNNRGHQNVIIAVLDTGLKTTHVDFKSRSESVPATLVINAWNVITETSDVSHSGSSTSRYHGTWISGVCSARVNNDDAGIAGVAWQCRLTPVKICEDTTVLSSNAEAGFNFVMGKTTEFPSRRYVIVCGWDTPHNASFQSAVESAATNSKIVVVAASGNYNKDLATEPRHPAVYSGVKAAGALHSSGDRWANSNHGMNVIMAPGVAVRTTHGADNTSTIDRDGTCFGAAFIAGAAALIWGRDKNLNGSFKLKSSDVVAKIIAALDTPGAGYPNAGKLRIDNALNFLAL